MMQPDRVICWSVGKSWGGASNIKLNAFINNCHNPGQVIKVHLCLGCKFMFAYLVLLSGKNVPVWASDWWPFWAPLCFIFHFKCANLAGSFLPSQKPPAIHVSLIYQLLLLCLCLFKLLLHPWAFMFLCFYPSAHCCLSSIQPKGFILHFGFFPSSQLHNLHNRCLSVQISVWTPCFR